MKLLIIFSIFFFSSFNVFSKDFNKAYFAGGCFWCMEESFEKVDGVTSVISGYSGGNKKNPTYKEVTFGNTGHLETIEVIYDTNKVNFNSLLKVFWENIDPFDKYGQFCDKGYSYRSAVFYTNTNEKKLIEKSIKKIEETFDKKVVTYIRDFKVFYKAEENHQDYYQKKFINYLIYKQGCGREKKLNKIWKK
tara:strand:- start:1803 stop:2378 length:576 start_codon:yes stop_codon:yes gene_type:complete